MIRFLQGNMLEAPAEAIVNAVNTVGVMGKGLALMFKQAFPQNFLRYAQACKHKEVRVGQMFVTEHLGLGGPRWIINFPTKEHWRHPSRLQWVIDGLEDLRHVIEAKGIVSIAVPPLGCGLGGLDWDAVRPEIERALGSLPNVDVLVFAPSTTYTISMKTGWLQT